MALLDPAKSLRVPARLCADPTDLATAFPHGGTDLGLVSNIVFRPNLKSRIVEAEEYGGEVVETIVAGESPILAVFLTGFNNEMTSRVFRETAVGSSSGDQVIRYTSTTVAGTLGSAKKFKMLLSPRDTTDHPGLLFYNALPLIEEIAEFRWSIDDSLGVPAVFRGIRDSNGKVYEIAKLEDMSLT